MSILHATRLTFFQRCGTIYLKERKIGTSDLLDFFCLYQLEQKSNMGDRSDLLNGSFVTGCPWLCADQIHPQAPLKILMLHGMLYNLVTIMSTEIADCQNL